MEVEFQTANYKASKLDIANYLKKKLQYYLNKGNILEID